MQENENLTHVQLADTVSDWSDFTGPGGLRGQTGEATLFGETVWMTRIPKGDKGSGFSYAIYDRVAWAVVGPAVRVVTAELVSA